LSVELRIEPWTFHSQIEDLSTYRLYTGFIITLMLINYWKIITYILK